MPRMKGYTKPRDENLNIAVTKELKHNIRVEAAKVNMSMSEFAVKAILNYIMMNNEERIYQKELEI